MKTYVIGLSQLSGSVGELAVLLEWALSVLEEVLAHLSFVLLSEGVPLALVSVEVVVVLLLGKVSDHFSRWVVEVLLGLSILT